LSNQQLAKEIRGVRESLTAFCDELIKLREQQTEIAARIAFIAPTDQDIVREVDAFVERATTLAA
jgi:DNA-directed RNA polymerase subunit F